MTRGNYFRGLVETTGCILSIEENPGLKTVSYWIATEEYLVSDLKKGDYIAVNGVGLTVRDLDGDKFRVDIWPDTFRKTNFSDLKPGQKVNLERSNFNDNINLDLCDRI